MEMLCAIILIVVTGWALTQEPWRLYWYIATHPTAYRRAGQRDKFKTAVKAVVGPDNAQVPLVVYNTLQRTIAFAAHPLFKEVEDKEFSWVRTEAGTKIRVLSYITNLQCASAFGDMVVQMVTGFVKSSVDPDLWNWAVGKLIQQESTLYVSRQPRMPSMLEPVERHKAAIDLLELRRYAEERRHNASATH